MVRDNGPDVFGGWAMSIRILLSSSLRKYVPHYDPLAGVQRTIEHPISVKDLCEELKIPAEAVKIAMINGKRVGMDHHVEEGDRVALFPPVGGG